MGREERDNRAAKVAQIERLLGPRQDFGSHPSGCPKCRFPNRKYTFCFGEGPAGTGDDCPFKDQHMHVNCMSCGFTWVERTADDPENPDADPTKKPDPVNLLIAILEQRGAQIEPYLVDIDRAKGPAAREWAVNVEPYDEYRIQLKLIPREAAIQARAAAQS